MTCVHMHPCNACAPAWSGRACVARIQAHISEVEAFFDLELGNAMRRSSCSRLHELQCKGVDFYSRGDSVVQAAAC